MQASSDIVRVEVSIPADPGQLMLLRSIAAALAISLDFDIDTMADLRMAVDELASTVITRARPDAEVRCQFVADGSAVKVSASAASVSADQIDRGSFGWMVLTTLADDVTGDVHGVDGSDPQVTVSLRVRPQRADR